MGIDMNDPKARQLLEKMLKKEVGASGSRPRLPPLVREAESRSPLRPQGQDRRKRPMREEGEPLLTKRPRTEEGEEEAIVPPPTIHLKRMKDFLDTSRLVLSG